MAGRFQFSIRFLLVATAAVAAGIGAACAGLSWQAILAQNVITIFFATGAIIAVIYTKGSTRAFWFGMAVMLGFASAFACLSLPHNAQFLVGNYFGVPEGFLASNRRFLCSLWCAAPLNGTLAALLHWLFADGRKGDA